MAINFLTRGPGVPPGLERVREAFAGRATALARGKSGNTIVLAAAGDPVDLSDADLIAAARRLKEETGLNLLPTLARWSAARQSPGERLRL